MIDHHDAANVASAATALVVAVAAVSVQNGVIAINVPLLTASVASAVRGHPRRIGPTHRCGPLPRIVLRRHHTQTSSRPTHRNPNHGQTIKANGADAIATAIVVVAELSGRIVQRKRPNKSACSRLPMVNPATRSPHR